MLLQRARRGRRRGGAEESRGLHGRGRKDLPLRDRVVLQVQARVHAGHIARPVQDALGAPGAHARYAARDRGFPKKLS